MSRTKGAKNKPKPDKTSKPPKAAAKPEAEAVTSSEVLRLTPGTFLKGLLSTCRAIKEKVDGHVGKLREEIAYGVSKKHLHKGAFADLRKYDKMEAEKASEHWHTLVGYMESSGVMKKIEAVGRLPLGDEAEGEAAAAAAAAADTKETGGEKVAEAEGNGAAAKVSRPHFGGRPGAGVSGTQLRPAADKTH